VDLYEHQGKELFARHGIPLVEGSVAFTAEEAERLAEALGGRVAVKAQVQIGGRGKGGGIALVHSAEEARQAAGRILSEGFGGTAVTRVLVEKLVDIAEQFYAAITLDRTTGRYLAMVSSEGGIDIEEIARERPAAIRRSQIDPILGAKD
jgi:succinyl-CoA synthetase beta subunit